MSFDTLYTHEQHSTEPQRGYMYQWMMRNHQDVTE